MKTKRVAALLLSLSLLLGSVGCGAGGEQAATGDNAQTGGTSEPVTALSLMQEVNQSTPQIAEDNYRTWYEVFVYSFYDSDGNGIGDLAGLTSQLDYINDGDPTTDGDLGCDGIWLMPIMPSTTYHKYDVTDYYDIDPQYGTMDDFKLFVEACHNRGINVIIDLVMNHSSSQHEWFQTAADYLRSLPEGAEPDAAECPYVDYYHFSRESETGYCQLSGTDWYYEARFWSEMPDINLGNEAVRQEFTEIVDYWLGLGVDGFRLDAAKEFYTGNTDANVEVLTWFNDMVKEKKEDAYIVAEVWTDLSTYANYYDSGIDSCFNFSFADKGGTISDVVKGSAGATAYGNALVNMQETLAEHGDSYIDAPFYTNHDMGRASGHYAGDYSENQTKLAQAMNLLMSGSAFLYYGEELGMKGSGKDENKRAPMYWSKDAEAEGMCDGPAAMDDIKMKFDSLEEQSQSGDSIYNFVKQTIKLRNSYIAISHGTVTFEKELSNEAVCVIRKEYEGEEVLLVFNCRETAQSVDLSSISLNGKAAGELSMAGVLLTGQEGAMLDGTALTAPAYSVTVLQ